ncbi:hypothetical protein SDC9_21726 [bioreactor metagenome]|uniref:Uncharacterized protein n=1 Tax=bioreactor metagenome TaxID=1076179 RepID=A0A644UAI1_9ZZZZ|nr:hypothetical protein [Candidatus Elulimicrobiales bacterium]
MKNENLAVFWNNLRDKLSKVDIKIYLYALGVIAAIVMIILTSNSYSKYGNVKKDGKFYLDIQKIASDYGINLNPTVEEGKDYTNNTDANLTEDLSRSLYLTNLYLEQNGMTDPTARGKILADIIFNYQEQLVGKKYTLDNLNIIREENKESLQEYYDDIYNTFQIYGQELNKLPKNPFSSYSNATSIDENTFLSLWEEMKNMMQKNININNTLINNLISIPATERGATYQLELINLISKDIAYYNSIQQIDADPAKYILINGDLFAEDFQKELSNTALLFFNYFNEFNVKMR